MIIPNEDVCEVHVGIPEGHSHVRTRIVLIDGNELIFQEATMASIVRAFIGVKTHPLKSSVKLTGKKMTFRRDGFAEWQLLEEE